jgi:hypothetical protein
MIVFMTLNQEDALYEFLENVTEPFELGELAAYIRMIEPKQIGRLSIEVAAFINSRNIAFPLGTKQWVSRRGCFESAAFAISPSRLELLNGILIPGHRCVPFANPEMLPQEYVFYWKGSPIPRTTTEGPPEDFYPYYSLFGEEYAPQYVARDNPENEAAYNDDPYEDPSEISINTLDMRNIYRESSFIPGDRFSVKTRDWKKGIFELERVGKNEWSAADLYAWFEAAEGGFEDSFALLGPGTSTEEQIAYAYWYGGRRMRETPAYALEDFLYEKTDHIEMSPYGIETRFWYAGREIPDRKGLDESQVRPDKTEIEEILCGRNIPISEYVIQSYLWDALYRGDREISRIMGRIVPPGINMDDRELRVLKDYIKDRLEEFKALYTPFGDKLMGPIRQRVGELHTAVIDLAARLTRGDIDPSRLPRHTFIILSQIQLHAAAVMEDLDTDEAPEETELETIDNSLDSMIETYEDIKEEIEKALESFRRNKLSVVRGNDGEALNEERLIQISLGGTEVWRRVAARESCRLSELHHIIQALFNWKDSRLFQFSVEKPLDGRDTDRTLDINLTLGVLENRGIREFLYEYGTKWTVKIMLLSRLEASEEKPVRCVAGAGAAPPEFIEGPLRFKKILSALEWGNDSERLGAQELLGADFKPGRFDLETCNKSLTGIVLKEQR